MDKEIERRAEAMPKPEKLYTQSKNQTRYNYAWEPRFTQEDVMKACEAVAKAQRELLAEQGWVKAGE